MIWLDRYGSLIASISFIMSFSLIVSFTFTIRLVRFISKQERIERKSRQRSLPQPRHSSYLAKYDTSTLDERLSNFETKT